MIRVTPKRKCPICHKEKWCLISLDGKYVTCKRVQDGALSNFGKLGYLHKLEVPIQVDAAEQEQINVDWKSLQRSYSDAVPSYPNLYGICGPDTYRNYFIGWNGKGWTFPVFNEQLAICGMQVRYPDGTKCSVTGTRNGVFLPKSISTKPIIAVTEGVTDAMTMSELGYPAIGKWNCDSTNEIVVTLLAKFKTKGVIIVADNDGDKPNNPGLTGAKKLKAMIKTYCPDVKVGILVPPSEYKDIRMWRYKGGLNSEMLSKILHKHKIEGAANAIK